MDNQSQNNRAIGFAGLKSLVSVIEEIPFRPSESTYDQQTDVSKPKTSAQNASESARPKAASPNRTENTGAFLFIGIIAVLLLFMIFNSGTKKNRYTTKTPTQASVAAPAVVPPKTASYNKPKSTGLVYRMPRVGRYNILSVDEIRWCERENIRISAIKPYCSNDRERQYFNEKVDNYNSRCSSYKYRRGNLQRAQRQVNKYRSTIRSEAIASFESATQRTYKSNNRTDVLMVQGLLKKLGYTPGAIDGIMGKQTQDAIKEFQQDFRLNVTGKVTTSLIKKMKSALNAYPGTQQ